MTAKETEPVESGSSARSDDVKRLFDSLRTGGREHVTPADLVQALERMGMHRDDPRIEASVERMAALEPKQGLTLAQFADVVRPARIVIDRFLGGRAVIPDYSSFHEEVGRIFARTEAQGDGEVADYIPQLGRVDPERFAVSVCTVDGQRSSFGDSSEPFTVQSCHKPVAYCMALEEHGPAAVHRHVGREPSGVSFNGFALNGDGLPHNPMANAGAIMSCALIRQELAPSDRFDFVAETWRRLAGGYRPGFSNATYLSERSTADRNFALGYSMRETGAFPEGTDLIETLEFYFQSCSIELTSDAMASVAATLAGGGVCPMTGERILQPSTVQMCLSLMSSCGMYDFSGEWAFRVGLPAKSGVSGAIWVVVPNVLGLCIWSPRLDRFGNSVRGIAFCEELIRTFNFHNYDNLVGSGGQKKDPRRGGIAGAADDVGILCWAASEGDLVTLRQMIARGVCAGAADYDGRTALHLAAAEGRLEVVQYLLELGSDPSPQDRWGGTPMDDALRGGHEPVVALLEERGGKRGERLREAS